MNSEKVSIKALLGYLPDGLLDQLVLDYQVDKYVKKLEGKTVFKLLLYGVLSSSHLSLNVLMTFFDKLGFRSLIGVDADFTTKRNSLADRLVGIDSSYFEAIFNESVKIFSRHLPATTINGYQIRMFDSTLVAFSSKLLSFGMQTGRKSSDESHRYKHVKFTVGYNGKIAEKIKFYDENTHLSDDVPLWEVIKSMNPSEKEVAVFDRGLKSRELFDDLSKEESPCFFVSRINPTKSYKVIEDRPLTTTESESLTIISDQIVKLYDQNRRQTTANFRLVIAHKKDNPADKIYFVSNILNDLSAIEITEIYRLRWEIERFFRFIKQNLNFSHFISRDFNAIKSLAYIMLIAAMFIVLFNKLNNRTGFKISKQIFLQQLEIELVKELIILAKGDPDLIKFALPNF